jgi:16S rRNA C967 or C1407 C5-methylase (RsmB/RsmF family)
MGKRWNRKRKNGGKEEKQGGENENYGKRKAYTTAWQTNHKMEAYYALQGMHNTFLDEKTQAFLPCQSDEEKEQERQRWMNSLRSILPTSFRLGQDVDDQIREKLEKELDEFVGQEFELRIDPSMGNRTRRKKKNEGKDVQNRSTAAGAEEADEEADNIVVKKIAPARKIPFIPHAYQLSIDRGTIRRNPELAKFHHWLHVQTQAGFITRQETVSMIPPVVLSVEPHHKVLDLCAAPGSKTSQILEIVSRPVHPTDNEPTGCVVANDSDAKRAYMLVHQLKRINSPAAFVTACDAQFFPLFKDTEGEGMFDRGKFSAVEQPVVL